MRQGWWLFACLLLAGCTQPAEPTQPPAGAPPPGSPPASLLPPSLVVDRTENDTLQLYLHAKQGNVRYDFINFTETNDYEPLLDWDTRTFWRERAYAIDTDLGRASGNLSFEVWDQATRWTWRANLTLNLTGATPTLDVTAQNPDESWEAKRTQALPYEKLLVRAREETG